MSCLPVPDVPPRRMPGRKRALSPDDERRLYGEFCVLDPGETVDSLAERYGIRRRTVYLVVSRVRELLAQENAPASSNDDGGRANLEAGNQQIPSDDTRLPDAEGNGTPEGGA